jgi:hypothetical protein
MWPLVPDFAVFLLTFYGTANSQRILNTFGYQLELTSGDEQPADDVSTAFFASLEYIDLETDFLDVMADAYTLNEAWFQMIFPTRIRKAILERNLTGEIAATTVQQNLAAVISRHGVTADRQNNGGVHLVLPNGATHSGLGLLTQAYKDLLAPLALAMLEPIPLAVGGSTYVAKPVLIHVEPGSGIVSAREIVATNVQDTVRVMRRRTVGLGI